MAIERRGSERREVGRVPDVEVRMDDFKIGLPGNTLRTDGLNTCIGLAFDHRASKTGAMGHLPDFSSREVQGLVTEYLDTAGADPQEVKAYLRGGVPVYAFEDITPEDTERFAQHQRGEVVEGLRASGIPSKNTDIQWLTDNTRNVVMFLDTNTGKFTSVEEDNPDEAF